MEGDDFEAQREARIASNKALLDSLFPGQDFPIQKKATRKTTRKPVRAAKRKVEAIELNDDGDEKPAPKAAALVADGVGGPRRSSRNAGKKVDYAGDGDKLGGRTGPRVVSEAARKAEKAGEPRSVMDRKHDP